MKELLFSLANYNIWANNLLIETILALPPEKQKEQVTSSFPDLYQTLLHMWNAESIWWQRLKLAERISVPGDQATGDINEVITGLQKQDREWRDWISNATEPVLQHEFIYLTSKKEQFKQPTFQMLVHLFNHCTYHRGQLVNMLRQLGVQKIPATDYIVFTRKK